MSETPFSDWAIKNGQALVKAELEINRLQSKNDALIEALKPFAKLEADYTAFEGDDYVAICTKRSGVITVGDLRKALSVLKGKEIE